MQMVGVVLQMSRGITPDDLNTVVGAGSSYVLSASDVGKQMYLKFPLPMMMGLQS